MRILEAAPDVLDIQATKRFRQHLAFYARGYPQVKKNFLDLCADKAMGLRYGKKDIAYTGPPLVGVMHAHLVHGKVIIVYKLKRGQLYLYDIGEHDDTEGSGVGSMAKYIASLEPVDFEKLSVGQPQTPALTAVQKSELDDLFYEMAASDPDVVKAGVAGDLTDVLYFASEIAEQSSVLESYGGEQGLRKTLSTILRSLHL
jgi:hypothetical protein